MLSYPARVQTSADAAAGSFLFPPGLLKQQQRGGSALLHLGTPLLVPDLPLEERKIQHIPASLKACPDHSF